MIGGRGTRNKVFLLLIEILGAVFVLLFVFVLFCFVFSGGGGGG